MSGEIEKEILGILEEAIKREKAACKLYRRGEEMSENQEFKKIFSMLAEEELGHEKLLKQVYYDYKKRLGMKVLHPENGSES